MALTIILPDYLETRAEKVLFAALQNFGADQISAREWRFNLVPLSRQEFIRELKQFLPDSHHWLLDRFRFKSPENSPNPLFSSSINSTPSGLGPR
jgi:hypothetical protein